MSELFDSVFNSGYSECIRVCECGITHFDGYNVCNWNDNELENLRMNAKNDPKGFIEHNQAIGTISIARVEIVIGCTCNLAERYENFIMTHAVKIAEYLNKRAGMLGEQAESTKVK